MTVSDVVRCVGLALCCAFAGPRAGAQDAKPPSAREQQKLVEAYFEVDSRTPEGLERRAEILARLDAVPPLSSSQIKSWKKKILKIWSKGRTIDKKNGQRYFFEDEDRGLYIVGGDKKPKGLLLCMHGGGVGSGDAWSSHGQYNPVVRDFDWLAVYPQVLEKTERGWTTSGTEEFVIDLIDAARRTWDIDPNHVFFAGHSMGGYGTWTLGAHHADRVAGLAPSAGAPTPVYGRSGGAEDVVGGVIPNLRNVPIVIYQSDDDPQVPPDANRIAAQKLAEAKERWGGFDYEYWEVTGRGHGAPPGGFEAHLEKIAGRVRDPHPTKVVWQPDLDWKRQFYWLWWDKPSKRAIVEAEIDRSKNEVRVQCTVKPLGLAVLLGPELLDVDEEVVVTLGETEVYRGVPKPRLSALLATGVRGDPDLMFAVRIPLAR